MKIEKSQKLKSLEGEYARTTRKNAKTLQLLGKAIAKEHLKLYKEPADSLIWLLNNGTKIFQEWTPKTGFLWRLEHRDYTQARYRDNDYIPFHLEDSLIKLDILYKKIILETPIYKYYQLDFTSRAKRIN